MKILALLGSPRPQGNTQAVLEIILAAAGQAGADTETIQLSELNDLTGCRECFACQQKADEPGCAIEDDMQAVLDKTLKADVIVWATPVFCWSPAWPLKMAMDRSFCMFKFHEDGDYDCLLKGRKMAAVITAGGGDEDGADLVMEICRRMGDFSKTQWLGAFVASRVETTDGIRADAKLVERARAFGRQLAS
ncbi:MAG: flavodoxin family protein [Phycisphaerae bacterium]